MRFDDDGGATLGGEKDLRAFDFRIYRDVVINFAWFFVVTCM